MKKFLKKVEIRTPSNTRGVVGLSLRPSTNEHHKDRSMALHCRQHPRPLGQTAVTLQMVGNPNTLIQEKIVVDVNLGSVQRVNTKSIHANLITIRTVVMHATSGTFLKAFR